MNNAATAKSWKASIEIANAKHTGPSGTPRPQNALAAWPLIAERVRKSRRRALFLDFDGTLVNFCERPEEVQVPSELRVLLARLARHKRLFAAIVSGRTMWDLHRLLNVPGLRLFGLHGSEEEGKTRHLGPKSSRDLAAARLYARLWLRNLPGIWIEDKGLSFAVHYRRAMPEVTREAQELITRAVKPFRRTLRLLSGELVWEVLPRELRDKAATVRTLMRKRPPKTLGIYLGDDATDEPAFVALKRGITIHVGDTESTRAAFQLNNPAAAIRFLERLEKEFQ